ncbi:MAG: CopG family ribbon-helix-helix protein [Actinomycetota bacterium]
MIDLGRRSKVLTLSLPPEMAQELDRMARGEGKSRSELFKDMFKAYKQHIAEKEWRDLFSFGKETAEKFNIKDEEELFKILDEEES